MSCHARIYLIVSQLLAENYEAAIKILKINILILKLI